MSTGVINTLQLPAEEEQSWRRNLYLFVCFRSTVK